MFGWLKKWKLGFARKTPDRGAAGAHPDGGGPPRYHEDKRALKDWYTSHWDLDYMSREAMDELARKTRHTDDSSEENDPGDP